MSASASIPWYDQVEGFIWNAATGTLSPAQKSALVAQQVAGVTQASGSAADPAAIQSQAQNDVTSALTLNQADPSQASLFNNPGLDSLVQKAGWVIAIISVAALIYFVVEAYAAFRK